MIAHIGITVSDIEISKKFYAQALNPIGYRLLREYDVTPARPAASAGFGEPPRADLWIYQGKPNVASTHIAFLVTKRTLVDDFYRAAVAAGETTAHRDSGRNTAPIIMEPSSSIPTVTTLKRCAERRSE